MAIDIKQFDGKTVTPKDDAILYDFLVNTSGVISGCEITHLGSNQLQITAGRGLIKGRVFVVTQETINATVSDSGTKKGRLIIKIDTANSSTPISFVTQMAATLPDLTQDDINGSGTVYEMELATYDISELLISNLVVNDLTLTIKSHVHGNVSNDGKIGTSADLPVFTTTGGALTTKSAANALTALGALGATAKAADSDLLDGHDTSYFQVALAADQTRKITISSSAASGGSNGDVWLKYS